MNQLKSVPIFLAIFLFLLAGCEDTAAGGSPVPVTESAIPGGERLREDSDPDLSETEAVPSVKELGTPSDSSFVRAADYIDGIRVELRYASENNFVGGVIYDFTDAWLRCGTVKKLQTAADELMEAGFGIKIWDAFRPVSAQFLLWEKVPDSRYVANPNTGFSSHSTGSAIDITLVDAMGNEVEMPTDFDNFSALADRDYSDVSETAAKNARLLEEVMTRAGFKAYHAEWWHFSDTVHYEPDTAFEPPADTAKK